MSNELKVSNEFIRKIALDNGFKLKAITESRQDLKPYVYDFSRALIAAVLDPEQAIRDTLDSHNDKLRDNHPVKGQLSKLINGTIVLSTRKEIPDTKPVYSMGFLSSSTWYNTVLTNFRV